MYSTTIYCYGTELYFVFQTRVVLAIKPTGIATLFIKRLFATMNMYTGSTLLPAETIVTENPTIKVPATVGFSY